MSRYVLLLTREVIALDAVLTFLLASGFRELDTSGSITTFVLSKGFQHLWYYVNADDPEAALTPEEDDPEVVAEMLQALGGPPHTEVNFQVSSADTSGIPLAMDFALHFNERWPCVLDNLSGWARHIFTIKVGQAFVAPNEREVTMEQLIGVVTDEEVRAATGDTDDRS